ncbi:MAG: cupin domain-containing protein [Bacteroidetes bacterium]|nr:cupin domain-containing protein [Bacteroidota bacterium]
MYESPIVEKVEDWGGAKVFMAKDFTESGLFRCDPGLSLPLHAHEDGDEYIYLFEGEGRFLVGEEDFEVKQGQLVKVPKGVMHRSYNTSDKPFVCFYLVHP